VSVKLAPLTCALARFTDWEPQTLLRLFRISCSSLFENDRDFLFRQHDDDHTEETTLE
jgi:hypothetical protein